MLADEPLQWLWAFCNFDVEDSSHGDDRLPFATPIRNWDHAREQFSRLRWLLLPVYAISVGFLGLLCLLSLGKVFRTKRETRWV